MTKAGRATCPARRRSPANSDGVTTVIPASRQRFPHGCVVKQVRSPDTTWVAPAAIATAMTSSSSGSRAIARTRVGCTTVRPFEEKSDEFFGGATHLGVTGDNPWFLSRTEQFVHQRRTYCWLEGAPSECIDDPRWIAARAEQARNPDVRINDRQHGVRDVPLARLLQPLAPLPPATGPPHHL